eukprot:TRINITY_DN19272_c0_g1_i1.p1 TRINITY_DN19272_c0_g1~~TRINITY_DN19272_c0_g1_i1.p1  ORF type:complete len:526 (+),score=72.01 TRINITY_DN19272_c0_g1_i1:372-1949(+)
MAVLVVYPSVCDAKIIRTAHRNHLHHLRQQFDAFKCPYLDPHSRSQAYQSAKELAKPLWLSGNQEISRLRTPAPTLPTFLRRAPSKAMIWASIEEFSSEDFSVDRLLGTSGFMIVSSMRPGSISPDESGMSLAGAGSGIGAGMDENRAAGYDFREMNRMGVEMEQGGVQTRLYKGRLVAVGPMRGTRVLLKAYPGRLSSGGVDADAMAANELLTHAVLQEEMPDGEPLSPHVAKLLGGFQTTTGEQWLVLRDDGSITAAEYAKRAATATEKGESVGEWDFWDRFDRDRPLLRRQKFIVQVLRGVMAGLAFMHARGRLHQSLGPASVMLNTGDESEVRSLVPRLKDFAFSVDISDEALFGGPSLGVSLEREGGDAWASGLGLLGRGGAFGGSPSATGAVGEVASSLWRRAGSAGAKMAMERKSFGIADDIYAAGLLLAYMCFVPLCAVDSIDGPALQRLLESTFRLDLRAARDYCAADDRWTEAVRFLDANDGAGWNLLQAMLDPDFRKRPSASSVLVHPFLSPRL